MRLQLVDLERQEAASPPSTTTVPDRNGKNGTRIRFSRTLAYAVCRRTLTEGATVGNFAP